MLKRPLRPYVLLLRPGQWLKSFFVFAPLLFSEKYLDPEAWLYTAIAALAFLSAACMVYVFNDLHDLEDDKRHPVKALRPLAAGMVDVKQAMILGVIMFGLMVFFCLFLPDDCFTLLIGYLLLNIAYTIYFKLHAVIDVVVLGCFYIQRILVGAAAIEVVASPWIILATFFLALTIGFAKRYKELSLSDYASKKPNLKGYNQSLILCLFGASVTSAILTYAIYVAEKQQTLIHGLLVYSVVFVAAGMFRFLQLVLVSGEGGEPEKIIFRDYVLLTIGVCWLAYTLWALAV